MKKTPDLKVTIYNYMLFIIYIHKYIYNLWYIYIYIYFYIYIYINDRNSLLEDCNITLIDKTDGSDPIRREEYWRRVLKTVTPYGLNTID